MYRAAGLQVVPSHLPSEHQNWKRPALADWKSLQEELVPQSTFDRWYSAQGEHARRPNMGLLTGRASGNIFVIDLDEYKTPDALAWWQGVLAEHNSRIEPETCQQVTGGGGRQLFFVGSPGLASARPTRRRSASISGGRVALPSSRHPGTSPASRTHGRSALRLGSARSRPRLIGCCRKSAELVERFGGDQHRTSNPVEKINTASPSTIWTPSAPGSTVATITCAT
jgi:hypothetical protein